MNFYITSLLIFVINQINKAITQGVPVSPCPKIFQYRFDGSEWFGIMSLRNPEYGQPMHLKIALSLRGKPTTNYLGEIVLLSRGQIETDSSIVYKIKFPKNQIPPKLLQVLLNNRIICIGPPDHSIFVTHIHLEHTRKFTFLHEFPAQIQSKPIPTQKHQFIEHFGSKQMPIINPTEKNPIQDTNEVCGKSDDRIRQPFNSNGRNDNFDAITSQIISRGSWPWLAAVYVNNLTSLSYQCGGTLISSRIVISSAHCFHMYNKRYQANEVLIFLGRHNLKNWNEEGSIAAPCDEIYIHPDYDSNLNSYDADIAIIVLKNEVKFNSFIRPACMWSVSSTLEFIEGERGVVVGWGHNSNNNTSNLIVSPKKVEATVVSNTICFKTNDRFRNLSSNRTFCAGNDNGQSPCIGDSGAGLMIFRNNRWNLRGIVSASLPHNNSKNACNPNEFIIYTDVAKFLDWIFAFII